MVLWRSALTTESRCGQGIGVGPRVPAENASKRRDGEFSLSGVAVSSGSGGARDAAQENDGHGNRYGSVE